MKHPFLVSDGPHGLLRGDVYVPEEPRGCPVVVGCHGFKGFKDWGFWPETGRRFAEAGIALVIFNVSGSGIGEDLESFSEPERFESNTISFELDDLGSIVAAMTGRSIPLAGADIRRLGLLGHSRGGGVALLRASRDPRVRAVVTWAAVSTFQRWDDDTLASWRERGFHPIENTRTGQTFHLSSAFLKDLEQSGDAFSPVAAMRRIEAPTLLVHGTRDETVPVEEAERLQRAAMPGIAKIGLIQGAGHTFGAAHPFRGATRDLSQVWERTLEWFREYL